MDKKVKDQTAKADAGKPQISLVPPKGVEAVAIVRSYGNQKYHDPFNWKTVEVDRYLDALGRHYFQSIKNLPDLKSFDEESGLPHLWQVACNALFLCELTWDELYPEYVKRKNDDK